MKPDLIINPPSNLDSRFHLLDIARAVRTLGLLLVMAALVVGCGDEAPRCLPGDQVQCQCLVGGGHWGYATCGALPDGGVGYGACDCILGLQPNRSSSQAAPYRSGTGTGNGSSTP